MAHYWQEWVKPHGIPAFVDFIDLDSAKLRQHAEQSPAPRRWVHAREARLLVQLEREVAEEAMGSSFVSGAEVEAFERSGSDARVVALENGVDGEYFAAPQIREISDPPRLIFVGQMRYAANIDAVRHLVDDILPLIRERCGPVQLDIIGPHPAPSVAALRAVSGVHVKGWIEDTRPYLWRASVAVVPLRLRQGTQNKVLEPMAASVPCVVSSIAARGLAQPSGPHIRVADHPAAFADAVEELLKNPEAARAQAEAALKLVQEHHNWDLVAARFESLLMEAVGA